MKTVLRYGKGRESFGRLYQRGGPLAHTVACYDDADGLTDAQFQKRLVSLINDKYEELSTRIDDAPKEVKKFQEDLTALKRHANDSQASMNAFERQLKSFGAHSRQAVGNHYTDPLERFLADPDKRLWVNAVARAIAFPNDIQKMPKEHQDVLKAFTGVDSSLGAATIPQQWLPEIYSLLSSYGTAFKSFQLITNIPARLNTIPLATARPLYYWIGSGTGGTVEGSAITEGSFTGTSVNLIIQTLAAFIGVSRELIADSSADMSNFITNELFQSIAFGLDWACLQANATADQVDGGYRGIFNAAALNVNMKAVAATGNTRVATTELEDWERCRRQVSAAVLTRPSKWWMHPFVLSEAVLIRDKNGRPLFQTALEAPSPGAIGSILGSPVVLSDAAPAPALTGSSANAKIAVFGDPTGMAVGIRQDFELAQSTDFRFSSNQICYRALTRAGVQIKSVADSTVLKPFCVLTLPPA